MTVTLELKGEGLGGKNNSQKNLKISGFSETTESCNLKSSLTKGNENDYKKALLLEKLRDALLEQTEYLMNEVSEDIVEKSRALAPRIFGWNNEAIPGLSSKIRENHAYNIDRTNYESAWEKLRGLETQSYRLEDPGISNDFFNDIQEMLINDDVAGVSQKHLTKYPWLFPRKDKSIFHSRFQRKKIKIAKKPDLNLPKEKTISQIRLEKDLEEKEMELRKIQSIKFQANPISASSIIPKYKEVMEKQSTKAMEVRQKANLNFISRLNEKERIADKKIQPSLLFKKKLKEGGKDEKIQKKKVLISDDECTFRPKISTKIPDFKQVHKAFEKVLEKSRSQKSTTIPIPFAMLSRLRKTRSRGSSDCSKKEEEKKQIHHEKAIVNHDPSLIEPKSTRTTKLKLQHLEEQKEVQKLVKELEEEQKLVAEEKKRAAAERIRMRLMKSSGRDLKMEREEKLKRHQEFQKNLERNFELQKSEMKKRIDSRRCLFERVQLDAARNQAQKKFSIMMKEIDS